MSASSLPQSNIDGITAAIELANPIAGLRLDAHASALTDTEVGRSRQVYEFPCFGRYG
ncbi:hypothetical protein Q31a_45240 [Aureliella helgolandensis]|uniref:Uncharacterized protein n=1 Tax=Aureliella helgolandensis TaxID=2527968 RepID=A0A518GC21_9BACT|nr:hypothetical protein Q31a_45240 [Aureliella helgolandensis]